VGAVPQETRNHERLAHLALKDARVREAPGRAQAAGQALQAARADLAQRTADERTAC
jgi:hypothetical protein